MCSSQGGLAYNEYLRVTRQWSLPSLAANYLILSAYYLTGGAQQYLLAKSARANTSLSASKAQDYQPLPFISFSY